MCIWGMEAQPLFTGRLQKEAHQHALEACTHTIRQFVSPSFHAQALADFYKLTYLNIRVRNGDAHLKNNEVLYSLLVGYHSGILLLNSAARALSRPL